VGQADIKDTLIRQGNNFLYYVYKNLTLWKQGVTEKNLQVSYTSVI
jgi:hypothetical protein